MVITVTTMIQEAHRVRKESKEECLLMITVHWRASPQRNNLKLENYNRELINVVYSSYWVIGIYNCIRMEKSFYK